MRARADVASVFAARGAHLRLAHRSIRAEALAEAQHWYKEAQAAKKEASKARKQLRRLKRERGGIEEVIELEEEIRVLNLELDEAREALEAMRLHGHRTR